MYFIIPFIFEEVSIRNKLSGNTVTIRSVNFDGSTRYAFASGTEQEEYGDIWMQSATLKEQPYLWNWLQVGLSGCAAATLRRSGDSDRGQHHHDTAISHGNG